MSVGQTPGGRESTEGRESNAGRLGERLGCYMGGPSEGQMGMWME